MHCASCVARVEKALRSVPGVQGARVHLISGKAYVQAEGEISAQALEEAVSGAGYTAHVQKNRASSRVMPWEEEKRKSAWRAFSAVLISLPFFAMHAGAEVPLWLQGGLSFGVWLGVGWPYHRMALSALRKKSATMDTLVSLGSTTAFWASAAAGVFGGQVYFDAAAMILTFLSIGRFLEAAAKFKAASSVETLWRLTPRSAHRVTQGRQEETPIEALVPGDLVHVRPGETIPADGRVMEGSSTLDESALTGEARPVPKAPGDLLFAGTLNGEGSLTLRVEKKPQDFLLHRVQDWVEQIQGEKASLQRVADRVAEVFVPVVLLLAFAAFLGWLFSGASLFWALQRAVATLVVACPCALGLAAPVALLAGSASAARHGLLIRRVEVLERVPRIQTIVLDKTGTLTEGKPRLADLYTSEGWTEEKILRVAAGIEAHSNHPLARALLREVELLHLPLPRAEGVQEKPGAGVRGRVDGREVLLGTKAFVEAQEGVLPSEQARAHAEAYRQAGQTVVYLAVEREIAAVLAFEDPLRLHAAEAVRKLKRLGLRVVMLTGDQEATAKRVAEKVGVDEVRWSCLPQAKKEVVEALRRKGEKVAVVGDGVNDAPALAAADLGIAMDAASDAAREAADLLLVKGDLLRVEAALRLCRKTYRVIRQNFTWAVVYNLMALPAAALGPVPPAVAAAAMSFSSLSVVLNALRLIRF